MRVRISGCIPPRAAISRYTTPNVQNDRTGAFTSIVPQPPPGSARAAAPGSRQPLDDGGNCDPHYPTSCIPPRRRTSIARDLPSAASRCCTTRRRGRPTHSFDNNFDGIGCQFDDY
jgi:hypothetical protein